MLVSESKSNLLWQVKPEYYMSSSPEVTVKCLIDEVLSRNGTATNIRSEQWTENKLLKIQQYRFMEIILVPGYLLIIMGKYIIN